MILPICGPSNLYKLLLYIKKLKNISIAFYTIKKIEWDRVGIELSHPHLALPKG